MKLICAGCDAIVYVIPFKVEALKKKHEAERQAEVQALLASKKQQQIEIEHQVEIAFTC